MQNTGQNNLVTKATISGGPKCRARLGSRARLAVEVAEESLYQGVDAKVSLHQFGGLHYCSKSVVVMVQFSTRGRKKGSMVRTLRGFEAESKSCHQTLYMHGGHTGW